MATSGRRRAFLDTFFNLFLHKLRPENEAPPAKPSRSKPYS